MGLDPNVSPLDVLTAGLADYVPPVGSPQFYGILAGVAVFSLSLVVVAFSLCVAPIGGGSGGGDASLGALLGGGGKATGGGTTGGARERAALMAMRSPQLYDYLLQARNELAQDGQERALRLRTLMEASVAVGPADYAVHREAEAEEKARGEEGLRARSCLLEGPTVRLREVLAEPGAESDAEWERLHEISHGAAVYGESAYPPERLWLGLCDGPFANAKEMRAAPMYDRATRTVLCIEDRKSRSPIGMVCLAHHDPANLSVEIADMWITPAYQGKGLGVCTDVCFQLLRRLFALRFRRVTVEVDATNMVARKALMHMGFVLEGILRKHRIVRSCSRDTCVFSMTNSDWAQSVQQRLYYTVYKARLRTPESDPTPSSPSASGDRTSGEDEPESKNSSAEQHPQQGTKKRKKKKSKQKKA